LRWLLFPLTIVGLACVIANFPHSPGPPSVNPAADDLNADLARVISETIYTPRVHHISTEACKTMFPPDEVGGLCEYYEGINLPDGCAEAYHMETQHVPIVGMDALAGAPLLAGAPRKVCHLNSARGEHGAGLDCETTRTPTTKGSP
jgi:hypothetical protein